MNSNYQLKFDPDEDRWVAMRNGKSCSLHCGEQFEVLIDGQPIPCRLECGREWYVIMGDTKFTLRSSDAYSVMF
jgi:hypothetical protein